MQFSSGLKRRKLNIAKLKLRRERILALKCQRIEHTNQYICNKTNTEHDEEYSQSTGLEEEHHQPQINDFTERIDHKGHNLNMPPSSVTDFLSN